MREIAQMRQLVENADYTVNHANVSDGYQINIYQSNVLGLVTVNFEFRVKVTIPAQQAVLVSFVDGLPVPISSFLRYLCRQGASTNTVGVSGSGSFGTWTLPTAINMGDSISGSFTYWME